MRLNPQSAWSLDHSPCGVGLGANLPQCCVESVNQFGPVGIVCCHFLQHERVSPLPERCVVQPNTSIQWRVLCDERLYRRPIRWQAQLRKQVREAMNRQFHEQHSQH